MYKKISTIKRAYLAGFLDGDGNIYVRLKPNLSYKYGFQVAPYIILFQSQKDKKNFEKICSMINLGYLRERKDGILEYTIGRKEAIIKFLELIENYVILKKKQVKLMKKILVKKENVKNKKDFQDLMRLIDKFRELNYSKKRKIHKLTP